MSTAHTATSEAPPPKPLRARAFRATLVSLIGQGGAQGLRFVSNLILSRMLFPDAFGLMAIVRVLMNGLAMVSDVGIQANVVRHQRGDDPAFLNTAWTISVLRGIGLWALGCAAAIPMAKLYDRPELVWIVPVATSTILITSLRSTKLMTMVRKMTVTRVALIDFGSRAFGLSVMIVYAYHSASVWALVVGAVVSEATRMLLSHVAVPGPRNRFAWDREAARDIISFGKWIILSTLIGFLASRLDVMMLSKLLPLDMLGIYSIALTMANIPQMVVFNVSRTVLEPVFAESNLRSRETLIKNFRASRKLMVPLGMVTVLAALSASPAFFAFLYDERYHAAGWIAQLALLRLWFTYLQQTASRALPAVGDSRALASVNSVRMVAMVIGCVTGYWAGDLVGLMIGMGLAGAVGHISVVFALRTYGLRGFGYDAWYSVLGIALACAIALLPRFALPDGDSRTIALATLAAGTIIVGPLGLWAALRVRAQR